MIICRANEGRDGVSMRLGDGLNDGEIEITQAQSNDLISWSQYAFIEDGKLVIRKELVDINNKIYRLRLAINASESHDEIRSFESIIKKLLLSVKRYPFVHARINNNIPR